ncbi:unnamed protein product, partial [marine sediment metagenome]
MTENDWISKLYIKQLSADNPPYQVDKKIHRRFDQRNNLTVGRPSWDEKLQIFTRKAPQTRSKKIRGDRDSYRLEDYSLFLSGGVTTFSMGNNINVSNRGVTSWETLG